MNFSNMGMRIKTKIEFIADIWSGFTVPNTPCKKVKMQFIHVFSQVITVSIFLINAVKSFKFVGANFFLDCQFCKGLFTVGM